MKTIAVRRWQPGRPKAVVLSYKTPARPGWPHRLVGWPEQRARPSVSPESPVIPNGPRGGGEWWLPRQAAPAAGPAPVPRLKGRRVSGSSFPRARAGFTLIELLLVMVILGILAAIVVPKFSGRTEQARVTAAQTQIATFGTALDAFEVDNGYFPKGKSGLLDLVQAPRDAQSWKGPYLKGDVPNDPWGHPYIYECPGKHNPSSYDVMSMGPDGRVGGDDDICNWTQKR